jgi:hypothetical protein
MFDFAIIILQTFKLAVIIFIGRFEEIQTG